MERRDELLERAQDARRNAYAPYSGFMVGAALLADDGTIHVGCNVENASFGVTVCAERAALAVAVAAGKRSFVGLAVSVAGEEPVAPCGTCRQALAEFAPDLWVHSAASERVAEWRLSQLLPEPFLTVPTMGSSVAEDA